MAQVNRYKQLFSFTLILSIGTILSKLMTYVLLTPLYTHCLDKAEFSAVEIVVQTANMLMPLVSLCINQAVLRFGMDGETDRGSVLTGGLLINLLGFAAFLLFYPLIRMIPTFGEHALLIYLFVFCANTHYLFAYCIKSMHRATLFTICVIIGTAITVVLDVLFLAVWDMGIVGYDNVYFSSFLYPKLTTVQNPSGEMAANAIRILLDVLENGGSLTDMSVQLKCSLVVRESC